MTQNPDDRASPPRDSSCDDGGELLRQAAICRELGSPFTADVLEAARRQLHRAPRTARRITDWPGRRSPAAVALRMASGLHALARRAANAELTALYARRAGDFDAAIGQTLAEQDDFLHGWLDSPPKTNEVTRAGAIMAALLVVASRFDQPMELLELGSSAGLNLNLHRYGYDLGGVSAGENDSLMLIRPEWRGPPPPQARVQVLSTRGVDLHPLDPADRAVANVLMAYIFADRDDRKARLAHALDIARMFPPDLVEDDAANWIGERLAEPQDAGVTRVVFHSIVLQYIPEAGRERILAAIAEAGARATAERPFAHISFEWDEARSLVQLLLTCWPDGTTHRLATCHAHAEWIAWEGDQG